MHTSLIYSLQEAFDTFKPLPHGIIIDSNLSSLQLVLPLHSKDIRDESCVETVHIPSIVLLQLFNELRDGKLLEITNDAGWVVNDKQLSSLCFANVLVPLLNIVDGVSPYYQNDVARNWFIPNQPIDLTIPEL